MRRSAWCAATLLAACASTDAPREAPRGEIVFERVTLSTDFTCEGSTFADLNRDGHADVVAGTYWYEGPDFHVKHELEAPAVSDPAHYSERFFDWANDFDGDGWLDLLVVGFPGKDAYWLRNPLAQGDRRWEKFAVCDEVSGESPAFADLDGDGARELVCIHAGRFGWLAPNAGDVRAPWKFHALTDDMKLGGFVHGLGVGDVDGDKRPDVLWKEGWYEQPASLAGDPVWKFHAFKFSDREGGAQMFTYDVDGDGDNDVITSLAAHHFGLSWFEQTRAGDEISFVEHRFMDEKATESTGGVRFGEIHALDLADINGDGLLDIVTGKRWWSHGATGDPDPDSGAVVYWFELKRGANGVEFVPHLADDQSGVGVQVVAGDVDGDGLCDIVTANKRGAFVLMQRRHALAAVAPTLDFERGDLRGWTVKGDAFALQPIAGDATSKRGREASLQQGEHWIGGYEKLGDGPKGTLTSNPIEVAGPWASFLVGGGSYYSTRVELLDARDDHVVFKSCGANFESMQRVVADLRALVGQRIKIRLVDESSDGWGHLNFDDFRFHAEKPSFAVPKGVPPVLPFDEVPNAGLSAPDAARAMTVPDGFHVDVIAAEPDVHQPIALCIDDRGRLWVAEAFTYPVRAPEGQGRDDILVFEDADHDGTFEKRTVFASGLNLVSGLEVGFGGVWVGAAPYLEFIPDRDGDLVPDGPPEILLDGWAYQDTHETLNSFTWGPDGWLYGCHGVFTYSNVGKPGCAESERTPINAGVWRFHPTRREFEVFAWGTSNPWGIDFDEHGQAFITACVIPHLYHIIQGGRYQRQAGEHFDKYVFDDIKTIADHLHYLGPDSHSMNGRSNSAGGGHAHCGLMIYEGDQWPEQYRGKLFFDNIHGNRINEERVEPVGSGFVGKHEPDFLLANDRWFRGIAFKQGPDGSMYFIDWYDKQACHLTTPEVWDRTNGRLYRVTFGKHAPASIDLQRVSSTVLAQLFGSGDQFFVDNPSASMTEDEERAIALRNEWTRRHARRILQERGRDPKAEFFAKGTLDVDQNPAARLNAMWLMHAVGAATAESLRAQMRFTQGEYVRAWAVQFAVEDRSAEPAMVAELERLAGEDPSPVVRLYLASGLQRLPLDQRWTIAQRLAQHAEDASDHNIPLMLWYGVEPLVAADAERALAMFVGSPIDTLARFVVRRTAAEAKLHPALVTALADESNAPRRAWMLEEALKALADQRGLKAPAGWSELYAKLAVDPDAHVRERAKSIALAFGDESSAPQLRKTLRDKTADSAARAQALDALVRMHDADTAPILRDLLDDTALRAAAIRALASFDDSDGARAVVSRYSTLGPTEKRDALNTLSSRASYAGPMLDAVDAGAIPRADLGAFVIRKLESLNDPALSERVRTSWGRVRATPEAKKKRIDELKAMLLASDVEHGDRAHGRALFAKTCAQCHTLFGTGGNVGPDLTGANRSDPDYLLSNVVDPNAVVGKDYLATLVWTNDERLVTGTKRSETDSSITLQTENELVVVAKDDIATQKLSDVSTMPEGLLDAFTQPEIRDLVAYLRGTTQVALAATKADAQRFFDGRSLAGWRGDSKLWSVENGELVGRSSGLARNEFLVNELELGDFKLSLEIELVGDAGNSGIQFRSIARDDGEMQGYQADVGPGWWGKLYEENGRGVLSQSGCESALKSGDWNRYEIEARGNHVRTAINGQTCVELDDPQGAKRGVIALQLHAGGATEVRFRKLQLTLLE